MLSAREEIFGPLLLVLQLASVSDSQEQKQTEKISSTLKNNGTELWEKLDTNINYSYYEHLQRNQSIISPKETKIDAKSNFEDNIDDPNHHRFFSGFMLFNQYIPLSSKTSVMTTLNEITTTSNFIDTIRRFRREDPSHPCYKFEKGDPIKREFYSPNYPKPYPKNISCYKVLEADAGMVLKVEFRDSFELEDHEKCNYDYLEVRDGKYGYSRPIGNYCRAFPFPEITSSSKYLWLHFHSDISIQGTGFRAVWSMIPRPAVRIPEVEECILNVTNLMEYEIKTSEIEDRIKNAVERGTELDCIWNITVPEGWKIQMTFPKFDLDKPNECDINYVQIYDKEPSKKNHPSLINNFCGSIADLITSKGNEAYLRFFVTKAAMKSNFEAIMTAIREKGKDKDCKEDEFDCQDACISGELKCNDRPNCRYRFDEDPDICSTEKSGLNMGSEHIIIVLIVFTLIMSMLCCTCIVNCIRKLIRDQKIIKEHLRQSREKHLDELGRKETPRSILEEDTTENYVKVDITAESLRHQHNILQQHQQNSSEVANFELSAAEKKFLSPVALLRGNGHPARLSFEFTDIYQSNNVSNATQERARQECKETYEEQETRDMACQTRESIFECSKIKSTTDSTAALTNLGLQLMPPPKNLEGNDVWCNYHEHLHKSLLTYNHNNHISEQVLEGVVEPEFSFKRSFSIEKRCSICYQNLSHPSKISSWHYLRKCEIPSIIPAPPGWSAHESKYSSEDLANLQHILQPEHRKYRDSKATGSGHYSVNSGNALQSNYNVVANQRAVGSGENYGFIYGFEDQEQQDRISFSSANSSQWSSEALKLTSCSKTKSVDSKFNTEAVVEIDQKRPFSIESTKSAPDVIATH